MGYKEVGTLADEALGQQLSEQWQVLCIVNRRDQAQELFQTLPEEGRYHLSTALCPADRRKKLTEIRRCLREGKSCRVISTSLVEAGVDVGFPVVYRALSGLDSILQAGGRCNREGEPGIVAGTVCIFESERPAPKQLAQNVAAAKNILNHWEDIASPEAVHAYFQELYYVAKGSEALDEKDILKLCRSAALPFSKVAEDSVY